VSASAYGLNKPLIIGEFSSVCSQGESIQQLFGHGYNSGYQVLAVHKFTFFAIVLSKLDNYSINCGFREFGLGSTMPEDIVLIWHRPRTMAWPP